MVVGNFARDVDVVVIGAGPGGYVAALKAAALGRQVVLVTAGPLGGTCLNVGCIPSKALIEAGHRAWNAKTPAMGISTQGVHIDFEALQQWKEQEVIAPLRDGIGHLLAARGVEVLEGWARFTAPGVLHVAQGSADDDPGVTLRFKDAIIATGSRPIIPSGFTLGPRVVDSTGLLALGELPGRLAVIGGGYIGMELAGAFAHLGASVAVFDSAPRVLAGFPTQLTGPVEQHFRACGGQIFAGAQVQSLEVGPDSVVVLSDDGEFEADYVLVAVGRRPATDDLGLEMVGIDTDAAGLIPVDETGKAADHVWAIGDVVAGPPLAHKASYEGMVAAAAMCGDRGAAVDYAAIPTVCFTTPEIAQVGRCEGESVTVPLKNNGRALSMGAPQGHVALYVEGEGEGARIVGAAAVGAGASELIAQPALAIENLLTVGDVALTIHNHPGLSELWMEAAQKAAGVSVHG